MRLRGSSYIIQVSRRPYGRVTLLVDRLQRRCYGAPASALQNDSEVKDVAVLGGGITALTTAYHITHYMPSVKVTIYESSGRLGGWVSSKHHGLHDPGKEQFLFEQGPRTLRPSKPNGIITLNLIHHLGAADQIIPTFKDAPAARNRFIYYPNHLVRVPGPGGGFFQGIFDLLTEPVFAGALPEILSDCVTDRRPQDLEDESVGSFLSRRFGPTVADNLASAMFHGIYAGDIWRLSARSLLPMLWFYEGYYGSLASAYASRRDKFFTLDQEDTRLWNIILSQSPTRELVEAMAGVSVFTLKQGLGYLVHLLSCKLQEEHRNVKILRDTRVSAIRYDEVTGGIKIFTRKSTASQSSPAISHSHTHAVSTLPAKVTGELCKPVVSPLTKIPSVTVGIVNLRYKDPNLLPVHGFGYLIPRTIPFEQNPEYALGVVFDSDAAAGQDPTPGTKLTVMLGGHWWDAWNSIPNSEELATMATQVVKRHLNITESPDFIEAQVQRDCIPQYTLGHDQRLADASRQLRSAYKGRLRVAGSSYTGVGLNDCVRAANDMVLGLIEPANERTRTGLELFEVGRMWPVDS